MRSANGLAATDSHKSPQSDAVKEPPVVEKTSLVGYAKGLLFSTMIVVSAFFGSVYVLFPMTPLLFMAPSVYRRAVDFLIGWWLVLPSGLIELLWDVEFSVSGVPITANKPALVIMNHRTRLDWLFYWSALFRMDPWLLTACKISLKGILKHVPGAGWAMALDAFLFLDRSFERDELRIHSLIDYYLNAGNSYQLLLFPEGTDKCPRATARSRKFAELNGLPHYQFVLHPRTTGFVHILRQMQKVGYLDCLYDVTIGYGECIVQSELDLIVRGLCPRRVHFDIRRVELSELPESNVELAEWLKRRWVEKEEHLRAFYRNGSSFADAAASVPFHQFHLSPKRHLLQRTVTAVWVVATAVWVHTFFVYQYQGILAIAASLLFVGCQWRYGGLEMVMARALAEQVRRRGTAGSGS